jgi:hypothetical protein
VPDKSLGGDVDPIGNPVARMNFICRVHSGHGWPVSVATLPRRSSTFHQSALGKVVPCMGPLQE